MMHIPDHLLSCIFAASRKFDFHTKSISWHIHDIGVYTFMIKTNQTTTCFLIIKESEIMLRIRLVIHIYIVFDISILKCLGKMHYMSVPPNSFFTPCTQINEYFLWKYRQEMRYASNLVRENVKNQDMFEWLIQDITNKRFDRNIDQKIRLILLGVWNQNAIRLKI